MNALDGNALAGVLAEALGGDVTGLEGECGACGAHGAVGAQRAWVRAPGAVLRCHACDEVLLVVVRTRAGLRVSFVRLAWVGAA